MIANREKTFFCSGFVLGIISTSTYLISLYRKKIDILKYENILLTSQQNPPSPISPTTPFRT